MKRFSLLLAVWLLGSTQPGSAGTIAQKRGAATLTLRFDGPTPKLALADLLTVTLTVEGSPGLRTPVAPLELPAVAPWILVERSGFPRARLDPARVRYQITYRFAPREPGKKIPFAFPEIRFSDGDNGEQTVAWDPILFEVETQIAQPNRTALRDITAIEELPPIAVPDRSWQVWLMLGGAGLMLIGIAFWLHVLLRRSKARSPAQHALYEWSRLVALRLHETGRSERFISLLSILLRRYLERQFTLPARRRTTPEFLANLHQVTELNAAEKEFLTRFFERCDAVKFARASMTSAECLRWANAVRDFLQPSSMPAAHAAARPK